MTKKPYILIIDDDVWFAEQHARTLRYEGYHVDCAVHSFAAIDMIDVKIPDIIISDVLLTGPNAFVLLHELRSHVDLSNIPVIFCTNAAKDIASDVAEAYGIASIIDKTTMIPSDLLAAVKRVLS